MEFLKRFYYYYLLVLTIATVISLSSAKALELNGCCKNQAECDTWMDSWQTGNKDNLWFRLMSHPTMCTSPEAQITINILDMFLSTADEGVFYKGQNENQEVSELTFLKNADIQLSIGNGSVSNIYSNSSYCVKRIGNSVLAQVKICLTGSPWYRKCCPLGKAFNLMEGCVELEEMSPLPLGMNEARNVFYPVVSYPSSNCSNIVSTSMSKLNYTRKPWEIVLPSQIRYYESSGYYPMWIQVKDNYCVDLLTLPPQWIDTTCPEQDILIMCDDTEKTSSLQNTQMSRKKFTYIYIMCLGIAMLFLAATALGFKVVEKRNIQKQTMLFYIMSQILFYFFIMIIYMDHLWNVLSPQWCTPVGVLAHFFGLSTFTWLSVINFDLWWTFRILQPRTGIHWKRMAWYTLFATLVPSLIISISLSLHHYDYEKAMCRSTGGKESLIVYPGYGKEQCFLSNIAQLLHFYIPIGILLLANFIFYSCTSYRLCSLYKKGQHSKAKKHRKSCQLLLKLFFVMGTAWILQVMHAMVEPHQRTWYWTMVDLLALSQAIAIFIIFICKRESWRILTKKYPLLKGVCCTNGMQTMPETTPEGSTRLSRTDGSQRKTSQTEFQEPSEIIQLP